MRQVLAIVAGALLAALGAVVLGEYDLRGSTVVVGFPLYGIAITELALAVAKRLHPVALLSTAAIVAAGLTWALWISFGHFRNDVVPPVLSWAMVGVATVAVLLWGRSGRRTRRDGDAEPAAAGATGRREAASPRDEQVRP